VICSEPSARVAHALSGDTLAALDQSDRMKSQKMHAEATLLRIEALSRAGQPAEQNPGSPLVDRARTFVQQ
jgi:hypothetical protein